MFYLRRIGVGQNPCQNIAISIFFEHAWKYTLIFVLFSMYKINLARWIRSFVCAKFWPLWILQLIIERSKLFCLFLNLISEPFFFRHNWIFTGWAFNFAEPSVHVRLWIEKIFRSSFFVVKHAWKWFVDFSSCF